MRISAKGRYALAATTWMANQYGGGEPITVIRIAEALGISKIYLEQVFSLLKRAEIVFSAKGAQGGYQLTRNPGEITVFQVLSATESGMFEQTEETVSQKAPDLEAALRTGAFDVMEEGLSRIMEGITLADLVHKAREHAAGRAPMYYI